MGTMADRITVGETRAFLAASYGIPHGDDTHFVIVAEAVNGMTVGTCCDETAEAAGMLRTALREIGRAALEAAAPILAEAWGVTAERKPGITRDPRARVSCRRCGAQPGRACVTSSGTRAPMVHAERRNDWRRAEGQTTGLDPEGMLHGRFPPRTSRPPEGERHDRRPPHRGPSQGRGPVQRDRPALH